MGFFKAVVNVVKAVIKAVTTSVAAIGKAVSSGSAKDIKNAVDTIEKGINDIENANKELEKEMKKKLKITTGAEDSGIIPTWEDIKKGWNNNMLMGKDPGIIIKCTKSFLKGLVYDTGKSALEGIGNMFMHPIKTAEGIANALTHPIDTGVAIGKEIGNAFNKEVINGDASSRAHFAGRALGEVALAVFGPKGVDKVTKIAKGSEYAAEAANALNKIKNISVNSEKLSQAVGRLNSVINKADELVEASTGFRISNVVEEYGKVGIQTIEKNERQLKYMEAVEDAAKGVADAKYTTKIKWGINDIEARPFGKGFWGKRIPQKNTRVDDFELKINPNDESFYLPHPNGGYVQFENLAGDIVQDGKLIIKQKSFYHVEDLPKFAQNKVIQEAMRQIDSAKAAGYKVEWLVSEEKAVNQLTRLFERENIDITVKYYPE